MTSRNIEKKSNAIFNIINNQTFSDNKDEVRMTVEGMFSFVNGTYYLMYDEYTELGNVSVMIKVKKNIVTIKRSGACKTKMEFEENKKTEVIYTLPFGDVVMDLVTDKVNVFLSGKEKYFELKYTLTMGNETYYNDMRLDITLNESEEK